MLELHLLIDSKCDMYKCSISRYIMFKYNRNCISINKQTYINSLTGSCHLLLLYQTVQMHALVVLNKLK